MNWMAPEVLERPYDERSDVWSLGCIILHATTCAFMDACEHDGTRICDAAQESQSSAVLFEIKNSSQKLEDVLKEVSKTYSKELCQVIRAMLRSISTLSLPAITCMAGASSSSAPRRRT